MFTSSSVDQTSRTCTQPHAPDLVFGQLFGNPHCYPFLILLFCTVTWSSFQTVRLEHKPRHIKQLGLTNVHTWHSHVHTRAPVNKSCTTRCTFSCISDRECHGKVNCRTRWFFQDFSFRTLEVPSLPSISSASESLSLLKRGQKKVPVFLKSLSERFLLKWCVEVHPEYLY